MTVDKMNTYVQNNPDIKSITLSTKEFQELYNSFWGTNKVFVKENLTTPVYWANIPIIINDTYNKDLLENIIDE